MKVSGKGTQISVGPPKEGETNFDLACLEGQWPLKNLC